MNREELQDYLQAQLDEVQSYLSEAHQQGRTELDMPTAVLEWAERFGHRYREFWMKHRHGSYLGDAMLRRS